MKINQIHNMDCLRGMKAMHNSKQKAEIIITSPPYNYGHPYIGYNDKRAKTEYLAWIEKIIAHMRNVLTFNGSLFLNIQPAPKETAMIADIMKIVEKTFVIQNCIHWIKSIYIQGHNYGRIRNLTSRKYLNNEHEYIIHATIHPIHVRKEKKETRSNVWFMPRAAPNEFKQMPPKFPVELAKRCIDLHGYNKDTLLLDPFMGLGTTAVACKEMGINFIGFEINELTCEMAQERIETWRWKNE